MTVPLSDSAIPAEKLSILVVDDDEPVRDTMSWMLQDAGHDVQQAADAAEALLVLEAEQVDLVISDINMPGMNGLELSQRARRRWPHVPVILVSGRPPPAGARPFLPKPFNWRTLATMIAAAKGALAAGD